MSNGTRLLQRRFRAQAKSLKPVRDDLCNSLNENGFDKDFSSEIVLAVDEACQNIIRHAYGDQQQGDIDLTVQLVDDTMSIELLDYAKSVNPQCCEPEPRAELTLETLKPGGLGTTFMSRLMDSVAFECPPPKGVGNKLIMKRRIARN